MQYKTSVVANLLVDIGNTALKAAWADGLTLGKTFRYQGERMKEFIFSLIEKNKPEVIVISSVRDVAPSVEESLRCRCEKLVIIDRNHPDVFEKYALPVYITPDRCASVIASRHLYNGRGCTVFDFGTTMTVDLIEPDGKYAGGNISPGCRTRFKALNRYSRSIPLLDTPDVMESLGTSLVSSVESGIINGIIFEIEGYIGKYPENITVFTGGDAIYFAKRMKNSIFVVCNLVLMGLAIIAEGYVK